MRFNEILSEEPLSALGDIAHSIGKEAGAQLRNNSKYQQAQANRVAPVSKSVLDYSKFNKNAVLTALQIAEQGGKLDYQQQQIIQSFIKQLRGF